MQWVRATTTFAALAMMPLIGASCKDIASINPQFSAAPTAIVTPPPAKSPSTVAISSPVINSEAAIWAQLRQGKGYVILFRHALAPGTGDPANFRLDDCATQRNLSAAGRQQAIRMGRAYSENKIL